MSLSHDEAKSALAEIGQAEGRADRAHNYRDAAPFLLIWGVFWLANGLVAEFAPDLTDAAWLVTLVVGMPVSVVLIVRLVRRWSARGAVRDPVTDQKTFGLRLALSQVVVFGFVAAFFVIAWPLEARQTNALISIFWAFAYMAAGVWVGWRLLVIGAVAAAVILFGYLAMQEHYYLWMGVAAGGVLIAGGLWLLRKI